MQTLSIQVHKTSNHPLVLKVLSALWKDKAVGSLGVYRVTDKNPRVNFAVGCKSAVAFWRRAGKKFNKLSGFKTHSIVTWAEDNDWFHAKTLQTFE